jgi:hypothetical protein
MKLKLIVFLFSLMAVLSATELQPSTDADLQASAPVTTQTHNHLVTRFIGHTAKATVVETGRCVRTTAHYTVKGVEDAGRGVMHVI